MTVRILIGDCIEQLRTLPDASVHCCVTSPPYFGLRDYGVDGQIGLETSPQAFVDKLVEVFREVRRVLRDDGTLWMNLGDSYSFGGRGGNPTRESSTLDGTRRNQDASIVARALGPFGGFKPKDLMGMPWRVAFALQADGWYLRQDIIWAKPNPMPESVRDRCTKSHEYLFLLSKSPRYYFDQEAILEPLAPSSVERLSQPNLALQSGSERVPGKTNGNMKAVRRSGNTRRRPPEERGVPVSHASHQRDRKGCPNGAVSCSVPWEGSTRNKRSVWTVATQPFKGAHFATFPPELIEPCIRAGSPLGGGHGTRPLWWRRNDRPCSRPSATRRDLDRVEPGLRRNGQTPDSRRCAAFL